MNSCTAKIAHKVFVNQYFGNGLIMLTYPSVISP